MGVVELISKPLLVTVLGVTFSSCVIKAVRSNELELFAATFKVMGVKLALAGCDMVTTDAVFCVDILKKMGLSP